MPVRPTEAIAGLSAWLLRLVVADSRLPLAASVKKPLTAEDAKDAEAHRGTRTMRTKDIDSLRVLCVLGGEEVLYLSQLLYLAVQLGTTGG
jgi:hypothetical protein